MQRVCPRCRASYAANETFCRHDGVLLEVESREIDPLLGLVIDGALRVEERIGAGAMGTVYRARDLSQGRDVALKVLRTDSAENQDAIRRFRREARIAMSLDHPNVARVQRTGELPSGEPFLVMELVAGSALADLMRIERRSTTRALRVLVQVADALGAAHEHAIVHRDVKPENVLVVPRTPDRDDVKVVDFGVARMSSRDDETLRTRAGMVLGTPLYISPEGASAGPTDARSDVYSLGALAYHVLCGAPPFDGPSPAALLLQHLHHHPPPFSARVGRRSPR